MGRGGNTSSKGWPVLAVTCLLVIVALMAFSAEGWTRPLALSGFWRYMKAGDGESERSFLQNYNIDFGYDLTDAVSMSGSLRYNRNWISNRTTEVYAPVVAFNLRNDIFSTSLSSSITEQKNSDSADFSTKTWEATWASNWNKRLWPTVRLFFGQSWLSDDQTPSLQDTESFHDGLNLDWRWNALQTFYSYYHTNSKDNANAVETDDTRHFVRGQYARAFFDDRLNMSLSQQFTHNRTDTTAEVGAGGTALIPTNVVAAYAWIDTDPQSDLPSSPNSSLTNQDTSDTVLSVSQNQGLQVAIRVDSVQVDRIYLYTRDGLTQANATSFTWAAYSSSNGNDWTLLNATAGSSYNTTLRRFDIQVSSVKARYIKLVATQPLAQNVVFSEVEARQEVTGTGTVELSRTYKTYLTDAGLDYRFTDNLDLAYTVSLEFSRPSDGADTDRRSQVGSLNWIIGPKLSSTFSISDTWQKDENAPETDTRSYAVSLNSTPIPTVDISLGITRNDNYEGGDKKSTTYSYSVYTTAALFPDLDSSMDLTYTTTDNYETDTSTDAYIATLILTARLTPKLTMDFNGGYNKTSSNDTDTDSVDTSVNVTWRPADAFSLRSTAYSRWESSGDDTRGISLNSGIATSDKTQLGLTYSYSYSTTESQTYSGFWSWTISEYLSFQLNGSYQITGDEEPWTVSGQLTARFSGI